jgi:aminoglycoside phosphotransferase
MVWDGMGGNRIGWTELPRALRTSIEVALGSAVVGAVDQAGGFSPGCAARLRLADGRRVFAKAMTAAQHPDSLAFYRREAGIAGRLPAHVAAPRLLWSDDGDDGVVLVFSDVEGHTPPLPWRAADWQRVHDAVVALARDLTPSPVDLPPAADDRYRGWRSLAADTALAAKLDPWARANLERLAALEAGWPAAVAGDTLVHGDLRADNLLLAGGRVVFVDWPQAMVGAPWLDLLCMLPSVAMQGGPDPAQVWRTSPLARAADPAAVDAALAALAGFFVHDALLAPPPGLPTLREFQRLQGEPALAWLRSRIN